jgi:hypothetical protein
MQRTKMEIKLLHYVHMHNACKSISKYDFENIMQPISNVSISLCMQKHINFFIWNPLKNNQMASNLI